jgi:hypothetical protein
LVILLPFEDRPRVFLDALTEHEAERLSDWIRTHDAYVDLVEQAIDLSRWQRAA